MIADNYYYNDSKVNDSYNNNVVEMGNAKNVHQTNVVNNNSNLTDSNLNQFHKNYSYGERELNMSGG